MTPIDTATDTAGAPIAVGDEPDGIAITPNGSTAYVVNAHDNTVTPIDISTDTAGSPITVGGPQQGPPQRIAITPDGTTAYVTNLENDAVIPIDTTTGMAGTPITVGFEPEAIAISPDQAPVAQFSVDPAPAGSPTSFDASASVAPSSPIATYAWNFGDGNTATTSTPTTSHTYSMSGNSTSTVTETDTAGTSTTRVFTGQTISRNGGPSATTSQSFVIVACSANDSCAGTVRHYGNKSSTVRGTSCYNRHLVRVARPAKRELRILSAGGV